MITDFQNVINGPCAHTKSLEAYCCSQKASAMMFAESQDTRQTHHGNFEDATQWIPKRCG